MSLPLVPLINSVALKPVLKWSGARFKIADKIVGNFPKEFNDYYEPMLGGGSVFLTKKTFPRNVFLSDENFWLIETYLGLRDYTDQVLEILRSIPFTKEAYDRIRKVYPLDIDREYRAAHLIYLNHAAFGGVFRVNRKGYFNVPFQSGKQRKINYSNLLLVADILKHKEFSQVDFELFVKNAKEGDFVYIDPPSFESRNYGFSGAKSQKHLEFREGDYTRLGQVCDTLDKRGVKWAVTYDNVILGCLLFSHFHQKPLFHDKPGQEVKTYMAMNY